MIKAYSYIRFSTPAQISGDSQRRQLHLSEEYASKHHLNLDQSLSMRDLGLSAFHKTNITHGALGAFLEAVRTGKVERGSYLLVESLDRLSRAQVLDALEVFISILNAGITIVTLADGNEYSRSSVRDNFTQLIISITIMSRAHEESLTKSKRLKAVWDKKRTIQELKEKVLTKNCPFWLKPSETDGQLFDLIPEHVQLVKDIFKWSCDGAGWLAITKKLNGAGVKTPRNRDNWTPGSVEHILKSRTVLGFYQPRERTESGYKPMGEPIEFYYPKIIEPEVFALAQSVRERNGEIRGRKGGADGGITSLFSGLLKCGYCEKPMHFFSRRKLVKNTPKVYRYLVCGKYKHGGDCEGTTWDYTQFENFFMKWCRELDVQSIVDDLKGSEHKSELLVLTDLLNGKKALRDEVERKINRLVDRLGTEQDSAVDAIRRGIQASVKEKDALDAEVQALTKQFSRKSADDAQLKDAQRDLRDIEDGSGAPEVRSLLAGRLRMLVSRVDLYTAGESLPFVPDKSKRFFAVWFKNGAYRIVQEGGHVLADEPKV